MLAVGDVADVGDPPRDRGHVVHVGEHLLHPGVGAVGLAEAPLHRRRPDPRDGVEDVLAEARHVVGVDQVAAGQADHVVGRVAEAFARGAGVGDEPVLVEDERDVGRTLDERAEALLRARQRVADLDQLGDVTGDLRHTDDASTRVVER